MRATFVLADVLEAHPEATEALDVLRDAGLSPVVLVPHPTKDRPKLDAGGYPMVSCTADDPDCWGDEPTLVLAASRRAGATPSEAFMVCQDLEDVNRACEAGCRPVLVLGDRTLDEVYGASEPTNKASICAATLDLAAEHMIHEAKLEQELGPFPYAHQSTLDERARAQAPTQRDLTRLMLATVAAGLASALGLAYFLQEFYQYGTFPSWAYWVTLQFIPQALRGALFLGIGTLIAVFAIMSLNIHRRDS